MNPSSIWSIMYLYKLIWDFRLWFSWLVGMQIIFCFLWELFKWWPFVAVGCLFCFDMERVRHSWDRHSSYDLLSLQSIETQNNPRPFQESSWLAVGVLSKQPWQTVHSRIPKGKPNLLHGKSPWGLGNATVQVCWYPQAPRGQRSQRQVELLEIAQQGDRTPSLRRWTVEGTCPGNGQEAGRGRARSELEAAEKEVAEAQKKARALQTQLGKEATPFAQKCGHVEPTKAPKLSQFQVCNKPFDGKNQKLGLICCNSWCSSVKVNFQFPGSRSSALQASNVQSRCLTFWAANCLRVPVLAEFLVWVGYEENWVSAVSNVPSQNCGWLVLILIYLQHQSNNIK